MWIRPERRMENLECKGKWEHEGGGTWKEDLKAEGLQ